jgi:hypothetical protein
MPPQMIMTMTGAMNEFQVLSVVIVVTLPFCITETKSFKFIYRPTTAVAAAATAAANNNDALEKQH